jgi:hypothetical protein
MRWLSRGCGVRAPAAPAVILARIGSLGVIVVVLGWQATLAQSRVFPDLASSESLWMLSLARDVLHENGRLSVWHLTKHPNFFPELIMVEAANLLGRDLQGFYLVYGLLGVLLLFAGGWLCIGLQQRALRSDELPPREIAGPWMLGMAGAFVATALPLYAFNHGVLVRPLRLPFLPAFHFPQFVLALVAAFLTADQLDRPVSRRVIRTSALAALLLFLTALCDKAVLVWALPPLVIATLYHALASRQVHAGGVLAVSVLLAAGLLAFLAADPFWNGVAIVEPHELRLGGTSIAQQTSTLWRALVLPSPLNPLTRGQRVLQRAIVVLVPAMTIALTIGVAARGLRRGSTRPERVKADAMLVLLLAASLLTPFLVGLLGELFDEHSLRFLVPSFYCPLLALAAVVLSFVRRPRATLLAGLTGIAGMALACLPVRLERAPFRHTSGSPVLECLREHAQEVDLRRGLGFHFDSHLVTLASGGDVVLRGIVDDARIHHWSTSLDWYGPGSTRQPFTFIVLDPMIDSAGLARRFGEPERVLRCEVSGESDRTIWVWSPRQAEAVTAWIRHQRLALSMRR